MFSSLLHNKKNDNFNENIYTFMQMSVDGLESN